MFEEEADISTKEVRSESWFKEGEYYSEGYSEGYERGFMNGAEHVINLLREAYKGVYNSSIVPDCIGKNVSVSFGLDMSRELYEKLKKEIEE